MLENRKLKIAVAGTGYVGLSIATLLAQNHTVTAVDILPNKVEKINRRISPIQDEYIEKYFVDEECGEWYGYLHYDNTVANTLKGNIFKGNNGKSRGII